MATTAQIAGHDRLAPATTIIVPGEPVPWARARRRGGRYFTAPDVIAYAELVQQAWLVAGRPSADDEDALSLDVAFHLARPRSHYGRDGQLLDSAPAWPIGNPDIDNLVKVVLDALTGLLYHDDGQVISLSAARKLYCAGVGSPRAVINAWVPSPPSPPTGS